MADKAWVTLATNDTYALGALVLAHSLKKVNTAYKLVVLVSSNVTLAMRGTLQSVFDEVKEVNILDSGDAENLRLLARPELGITFTKLHAWRLTQYQKCVFLDADTLVLQNCDELFEREELSAAPDVGWPDCFNSGVFVFKPSEETFKALFEFAIAHGSFDGGDQGLLNMFFSDWATSNASKRLPFLYNLSSAAIYSYLPAFKWYGSGVKIVHFIGNSKPWSQPFNSATRTVEAAPGSSHLQNFLQYWWDLFCACVYQQLSPEMTRLLLRSWYTPQFTIKNNPSRNNPMRNEVYIPEPFIAPEVEEHFIFTDPWEEFEKNIMASVDVEPSNNVYVTGYSYVQNYNDENVNSYDEQKSYNDYQSSVHNTYEPPIYHNPPESATVRYKNPIEYAASVHTLSDFSTFANSNCSRNEYQQNCQQNSKTERININNKTCIYDDVNHSSVQNDHSCDIPVNTNYSSLHSLKNEILREENLNSESKNEINDDAGLANSLSQITLEEPTPAQKAREDYQRRQNWEQGNIDYMGQDSFSNIWQKISETMNFEETKPEAAPSTIASPAPVAPVSLVLSAENPAKVESSVPEVCPLKPTASAESLEPIVCPLKPAASAEPSEPVVCLLKPTASAEPSEPVVCPKPSKPSANELAPAKSVAEFTTPAVEPVAPKAPITKPATPIVQPATPQVPVAEPAAPQVPVVEPAAPTSVVQPGTPKVPASEPAAPKTPATEPAPPKTPVVQSTPEPLAPASQVPPKPETLVAPSVCQKPTAVKEPAVASPKEEPQTAKSSEETKSAPEQDPNTKQAAKPSASKK